MKYNTDASSPRPSVGAIILCAGKGERTGLTYNKVLHRMGVKTVLETTLDAFKQANVSNITVVAAQDDLNSIIELTAPYDGVSVVTGGFTRFESVLCGLKAHKCDIVIIHDGARPFVTVDIIERSVMSAIEYGSGIAAVKTIDTVKQLDENGNMHSMPRDKLLNMQTPQTFRYSEILKAYESAKGSFTDDAEVYESAGYSPRPIEGSYDNIKITTAADLIKQTPRNCRIGVGFDVHRLVDGRPLILGGVKIDYPRGLDGHSDADVLVHAIMDALLSATGLPDIGVLFPDTDDKYLGASSMGLLERVVTMIAERNYTIENVSAVIIAQRPKLAPIINDIRASLSHTLGIDFSRINVSATTTERLGLIGSGDAIASDASCILSESI